MVGILSRGNPVFSKRLPLPEIFNDILNLSLLGGGALLLGFYCMGIDYVTILHKILLHIMKLDALSNR